MIQQRGSTCKKIERQVSKHDVEPSTVREVCMSRRSHLKSMLGAIVAASVAPRLFEPAGAAEPSGLRETVPATLAEALNSGTSDSAAAFVLRHPDAATTATTADKAALLRLLAKDQRECATARPAREQAALTLLQPSAAKLDELAALVRGFGGAQRVQAVLPAIQSKELNKLLTQALGAAR
jgi:hypothetical protein